MKQTIGHRIRKIRESKDLSQENIAFDLGISKGAYSKIETGKTSPSVNRILEIAKILEIDVREFFTDSKKTEDTSIYQFGFATKNEVEELAKKIETITNEMKAIRELLAKN